MFSMEGDVRSQLKKTHNVETCSLVLTNSVRNSNGETAVLNASRLGKWDVVGRLLKQGADKDVVDCYGHSLFSRAVYDAGQFTLHYLSLYSKKKVNSFCKTIPLDRAGYEKIIVPQLEEDVYQGKKDIQCRDEKSGNTALHYACLQRHIPIVVALLKRGASLHALNNKGETPYGILTNARHITKPVLFAVREALNDGSCLDKAVLIDYFLTENKSVLDVACYIKFLYIQLVNPWPEVLLWKPVCFDALQAFGIYDTNQDRCLRNILSWPQKIKTKVNIQLLLKNK